MMPIYLIHNNKYINISKRKSNRLLLKMGNCNFKTETENDNVTGISFYLNSILLSYNQKPFSVSLCDWKRWFWQSLES